MKESKSSYLLSESSNLGRRKILGVMGLSTLVVPTQWKKPVVNSVLIPAHAATSPEAQSLCDDTLRFEEEIILECPTADENSEINILQEYAINDESGDCPFVEFLREGDFDSIGDPTTFRISTTQVTVSNYPLLASMTIAIGIGSQAPAYIRLRLCGIDAYDADEDSFSGEMISASGATYGVTGTVSWTTNPAMVEVVNVEFTPN